MKLAQKFLSCNFQPIWIKVYETRMKNVIRMRNFPYNTQWIYTMGDFSQNPANEMFQKPLNMGGHSEQKGGRNFKK